MESSEVDISVIKSGDVVALIGDFESSSISLLLRLIEMNVVIVPLTKDTRNDHGYFFQAACVDFVIEDGAIKRLEHEYKNVLLEELRLQNNGGLILFTSGSTGRPKAILHSLRSFLKRFETPRPAVKTMGFLMFDHIGGLNTLFHTLYNMGVLIVPKTRGLEDVMKCCQDNSIEVLPTTPTFLRLLLIAGYIPDRIPNTLKIITYGTERMDQVTLDTICSLLPWIDFRQTYGMSELGILRVKSRSRESLFMKIGGEGVETRVVDGVLQIRSTTRMMGYMNADQPFDQAGWYNTKDRVEEEDGYIKIVGRMNDLVNVGGLKFMLSEVEAMAMKYPNLKMVSAISKSNPITGSHVELIVVPTDKETFNLGHYKSHLKETIPRHMCPTRVTVDDILISHRFKKMS